MQFRVFALVATSLVTIAACGANAAGFGTPGGDDGGTASDGGGGGGGGWGGGDAQNPGPTFGSTCNGSSTTVTGTAYAPNGIDPLPNVLVYAASQVNPFPTANYCNQCDMPIDPAYATATSGTDGKFTLDLAPVPVGSTITFVVNIGRFRKVTKLSVKACGTTATPKAAGTLPGSSADGDIPKIAVSTGTVDHLDQILSALGITEYDCYEGRSQTGSSTPTCMPLDSVSNLLTKASAKHIDQYHLFFASCAPNAYKDFAANGVNMAALTANLNAFVTSGGRFFATDMSYDYVAQTFPADVSWMGPAGSPQPVDGANVGVAGSYPGNVDDPLLKAWLNALGVQTNPSVPLTGFLNPWSVQATLPGTSTLIVDGTVNYTGSGGSQQSGDVPLTSQFDVAHCGRVIYSSYHTANGNVDPMNLKPQERILEYLMFSVATCVAPPPR